MLRTGLVSFLFTLLSLLVVGQEFTVTGKIVSKSGKGTEFATVRSPQSKVKVVYTDLNGQFSIPIEATDSFQLYINLDTANIIERYAVSPNIGKLMNIGVIKINVQELVAVNAESTRQNVFGIETVNIPDLDLIPMGNLEKLLVLTTAATSNNELTSNYNVRGGSYDENLVYVNGFLIYRPFLTRSGQQEGMSFINTALVEDVSFSAGGFDAKYGDKLSSVLDIKYRDPIKFRASGVGSLLGVQAHVEQSVNSRFSYMVGLRYRANGYLLNALPAKGAYNPVFMDGQFVTKYAITEKWRWEVLGHFSSNDYRFAPQTQKTDFGTVNEAYSFNIYYEGQERTRFLTAMAGTALKYEPDKKTNLDFYATVFRSVEREYFDILGQYFINELETDPSKETFGDSVNVLGIGSFLNHARNKLDATIYNVYHRGRRTLKDVYLDDERTKYRKNDILWGVNFQHDQFYDVLSEWRYIDSAGYSVPQTNPNEVELFETIKGRLSLSTFRATSFVQLEKQWWDVKRDIPVQVEKKEKDTNNIKVIRTYRDTILESVSKWALNAGLRGGHTQINGEYFLTPRASITYIPRMYMYSNGRIRRRDVKFRLATGLYYQMPIYREFRTFEGALNTNVKSQKSLHIVAGGDYFLNLWGRKNPFKLAGDIYYKYLWDVNPYEIDNVRTRYYAQNNAVAYAYGFDVHMNGEFVEGIESYFKMGVLRTREDILDDFYYEYFNSDGEKIIFGYTVNDSIADSVRYEPGYIPRPTDQLFTFGALIQDQMPGYESFSVQMGMQFGTRLPYGPPDRSRYKDTLRMKSYFRVDIGFSYDFLYKKKNRKEYKTNFWTKNFEDAIISFEVFNLLGIDNVLSKQWIQDVNGRYYSIPNNLTQRRFNVKLIFRL